MRLPVRRLAIGRTTGTCALLTLLLAFVALSFADAAPFLPKEEQRNGRSGDMRQILSVVEHRTMDGRVLERMREKLPLLGERELHLAASLCERISLDERSAGASIAYSIVTAMIVLL